MTTIVLRQGATGASGVKNAPLTITEVDANINNLNTYKVEQNSDGAILPAATGATGVVGYVRYNPGQSRFEGYGASGWNELGSTVGGATGPVGASGTIGVNGASGPAGPTGATGAGGAISNDITTNASYYPTMSDVYTGTATAAYVANTKLYFNPSTGTLNSIAFNSLSDKSYKQNINTIVSATDIVNKLDGVSFEWKDNGLKSFGVIAQDLELILPELVEGIEKKSVNYSGIIAFLINAVKELDSRVKYLENK